MNKKLISILLSLLVILLIASGYVWFMARQMNQTKAGDNINRHAYARNIAAPKSGQTIKRFILTAQASSLYIKDGLTIPVWTYNGTVPGPEIRVKQGDFVQVELRNTLPDPVTIHWHGYPLLSAMDGVPGINQDAVKPGEVFTYEFSADVTGTYWYHSHQEGAQQVDKGLYGALVVEPKDQTSIDKDFTLILDEWMEYPVSEMGGMAGMNDTSSTNRISGGNATTPDLVLDEENMMSTSYNIYTVNGKSGYLVPPLLVQKGNKVRLRFVNAGYRSHGIHFAGQAYRVVTTDGQEIAGATEIKNQILMIAPGERYDVDLTITGTDDFTITSRDENLYSRQIRIPIRVTDGSGKLLFEPDNSSLPRFDLSTYGSPGQGKYKLNDPFTVDYKVELNTKTDNNKLKYTINGRIFSELPPLIIKSGDLVKFTFENKSKVDHPMHLHGHFFEVLAKNDRPLQGAVITKDSLLVKPGEKYTVAFKADNPGRWVQHCHELHHAAAGMMQGIVYADFSPNYTADPRNTVNKPE